MQNESQVHLAKVGNFTGKRKQELRKLKMIPPEIFQVLCTFQFQYAISWTSLVLHMMYIHMVCLFHHLQKVNKYLKNLSSYDISTPFEWLLWRSHKPKF